MNKNFLKKFENKIDKSKWNKCKFSNLVQNIVEKVTPMKSELDKYIGLKHLDSKSLKIRRFDKNINLIGDKQKIYKGDLIFAKRNSYLKRIAIAEFDAIASAHSMVLRAKSTNVLPEFLPYFLLSETFWKRAISISVGSLSPTINWKTLAKQEFFLPPKNEQKKLTDLFESINDVINKEKILKDKMKIKTDVFALDHIRCLKNNKELKLKEICRPKQWKTIPKKELTKKGYLVYGGNGIIGYYKEYNHESPVIAIACRGEYCGNIHLTQPKSYITGNSMCLDTLDTNRIKTKYLYYYLYYNDLSKLITGSAQPQIIREDVENFKIKDVSINIQKDFIKKMDSFWLNINGIEDKIRKSKNLQLSLIEKIFNEI